MSFAPSPQAAGLHAVIAGCGCGSRKERAERTEEKKQKTVTQQIDRRDIPFLMQYPPRRLTATIPWAAPDPLYKMVKEYFFLVNAG
jgi:hypothetical protein